MRTPITYFGGKQQLADKIISMMPSHKIYCEAFFGGGAVFFAKPKSYFEVINEKLDMPLKVANRRKTKRKTEVLIRNYRFNSTLINKYTTIKEQIM